MWHGRCHFLAPEVRDEKIIRPPLQILKSFSSSVAARWPWVEAGM
jgi:hypothetical protein